MTVPDLLPVATQAPDFTLPASDGQPLTLSALRGRKHVVLIFYVGDNTPDCNRQLSSLRDDMPELEGLDIAVMGINPAGGPENTQATPENPIVPGSDTRSNAQNRIESVGFPAEEGVGTNMVVSPKAEPGVYLVICTVRGHFLDGMFAFVEVKAEGEDD